MYRLDGSGPELALSLLSGIMLRTSLLMFLTSYITFYACSLGRDELDR